MKKKKVLPLVTTFYSNYDNSNIAQQANLLLDSCTNNRIKDVFEDHGVITAYKQPPNLLKKLSQARFDSFAQVRPENGQFRCHNKLCKLCALYIKECKSFITANGYNWIIKNHITCNSKNVLYYLVCLACKEMTYTGKTNIARKRMNVHFVSPWKLNKYV